MEAPAFFLRILKFDPHSLQSGQGIWYSIGDRRTASHLLLIQREGWITDFLISDCKSTV